MVDGALDIHGESLYNSYSYDYPMESQETLFRYSAGSDSTSIVGTPLNQGAKKLCKCGCGKEIILQHHHKYYGIPNYISGHQFKPFWEKGNNKIKTICLNCNNSFFAWKGEHRKYCSMECYDKSGKNNPFYGKKHTEKVKIKLSEIKEGINIHTDEYKERMRVRWLKEKNPNYGRIFSKECREEMSKSRIGKKMNFEQRKKLSARQQNISVKNWKQFITPLTHRIRTSVGFKQWRKAIFERDNYACQECGDRNCKGRGKSVMLNVHHIKKFSKYPKLRFNINNGITLCDLCHYSIMGKENLLIGYFTLKLNNI